MSLVELVGKGIYMQRRTLLVWVHYFKTRPSCAESSLFALADYQRDACHGSDTAYNDQSGLDGLDFGFQRFDLLVEN